MKYEKEYHTKVHNHLISNSNYYLLRAKIANKRYFAGIKEIKSKKVLEFGSGLGQNLFLLQKGDVFAYDISNSANEFARKKGIKIIPKLEKIKDNSFDLILSSHNLEHLENPLENLIFLNSKLKSGGKLLLVLPSESRRYSSLTPDLVNYHLFSWNFRTINNLLSRAGFTVEKNKFYFGTAYSKLSFISNFSFPLYIFAVSLAGLLTNRKDMFIIARKK